MLKLLMLLAEESNWCKGKLFCGRDGEDVEIDVATKFSLLGALLRLHWQFHIDIEPIKQKLEDELGEDVSRWNDKEATTYYHVRKLLMKVLEDDGMERIPETGNKLR